MPSLNLSYTHTFIVNGRKVKTVDGLLRRVGKSLLEGKDIWLDCKEYATNKLVNSTIILNYAGRHMTGDQLANVCLWLIADANGGVDND